MNDFILEYYHADSSICDELIDFHTNNPDKVNGYIVGYDGKEIDKSKKDSIDVHLLNDDLFNRYNQYLQDALNVYIEKYPQINIYGAYRVVEYINVQCFPPMGGFKVWHSERGFKEEPNVSRMLFFITYLNTVKDGATEFLYQQRKVEAEKGKTMIAPVDFTHTHRSQPNCPEYKYIVAGWFNYI